VNTSAASSPESPVRRLRVGFDFTANYVTRAGLARYVQGLQRGFEKLAPPDIELVPLAWPVENFGYRQPMRALKTAYRELVWGRFHAPRFLRRAQADLLHSTSSLFIRRPPGIRHVVTLHDLSISRHPERFRRWQIDSWHRRRPVITSADRVICISQFTADEAVSLLGVSRERIRVVHNGCDWHANRIAFRETLPDFPVPPEFFLFVGSLEPGKNLSLLRQTWQLAAAEQRPLPPLLMVGARWEGVGSEGAPPPGWHYLGWQPDSVLLHLYRRAKALLFPSIYEGFGLPVIEAMAQGCAVVCSPVSSLPEIAGAAAFMTPLDPAAYRDTIRKLDTDSTLRAELADRGRRNAARFTWERCAEETAAVYREVAGAAP
jgi:glycosyltransferase involved in cell wall biosynthesis